MTPVITKISPAGLIALKGALLDAELRGYDADACSRIAQTAVGLYPPMPRHFVVDYTLDGPVYPFMAWPEDPKDPK